ncbi:MAG TPA: FGGY family carbohydrate kinase [Chryseosolibacter sp.]
MRTPVILIFDVGKTNKKVLVFDQGYRLLTEESVQLPETRDEDGFPCEDVALLTDWVKSSLEKTISRTDIQVQGINFSGYGASFVCVDQTINPVMHLCNYLKPYPSEILAEFYKLNGGIDAFSRATASPSLGNLNSGLQLFSLQKQKPDIFKKIRWALHLPQYLSSIVTNQAVSDMTSIGCHTGLWDFTTNQYHQWVKDYEIDTILPRIHRCNETIPVSLKGQQVPVGIGLHDSSAALIPYLATFHEPFVLLSTGTWNICLNPFNHSPLTIDELQQDCLSYLTFSGKPVKASRLFAGHEHEEQVLALAEKYSVRSEYFLHLTTEGTEEFHFQELPAIAYLDFMKVLVEKQEKAIRLALGDGKATRIFVDGGFSKNEIFMKLLSQRFAGCDVFAAHVAQASALGTALVIHSSWNPNPVPKDLIDLKRVSVNVKTT